MDPEAGGGPMDGGGRSDGGQNSASPSAIQLVIQAVLHRLQALVEAFATKREVGVENRFYYDEVEKQWKLQGGETEAEKAEAEAIRFHTSRGLMSAMAPATTACDASRGAESNFAMEPPPMTGPVSHSLHNPVGGPPMASLSHPVYAPQGLGGGGGGGMDAPPPMQQQQRPRPGAGAAPPSITSPFGAPPPGAAAAAAPRTSPFGAPTGAGGAPGAPIASPFGGGAAAPAPEAAAAAAFAPPAPQEAAMGGPAPLANPFQQFPAGVPGAATALATPFHAQS